MIRGITVAALLTLLALVLYLPSRHPPKRFLDQIRADHAATQRFWGEDAATQVLARALSHSADFQDIAPVPSPDDAPRVQGAVAHEMASANARLFDSRYFRSTDALLLLAGYRLSLMLHGSAWLAAFIAAVFVDSHVLRQVKSLEFGHHDPEVFAGLACAAILVACAGVVALVLPVALHPTVLPCVPLAVGTLSARAVADFHRRR